MGFDMQEQGELNGWMAQTIQYAMICDGKDEIDQSEVIDCVKEVSRSLPRPAPYREIVSGILERAKSFLTEDYEPVGESIEPEYLTFVIQWAMKTIAAVWIARGRAFDHEKIEAVLQHKIVGGVQGNRNCPSRQDLDLIVRKTIAWGRGELDKDAVAA